jgi:hypothetical protein
MIFILVSTLLILLPWLLLGQNGDSLTLRKHERIYLTAFFISVYIQLTLLIRRIFCLTSKCHLGWAWILLHMTAWYIHVLIRWMIKVWLTKVITGWWFNCWLEDLIDFFGRFAIYYLIVIIFIIIFSIKMGSFLVIFSAFTEIFWRILLFWWIL